MTQQLSGVGDVNGDLLLNGMKFLKQGSEKKENFKIKTPSGYGILLTYYFDCIEN